MIALTAKIGRRPGYSRINLELLARHNVTININYGNGITERIQWIFMIDDDESDDGRDAYYK